MKVLLQKWPCRVSYQVPNTQHSVEVVGHGVVLHGHEEGVEHDADGDGKVQEGVHHHRPHQHLHLQPPGGALPHQAALGKGVPAWWALLLGLLQFCSSQEGVRGADGGSRKRRERGVRKKEGRKEGLKLRWGRREQREGNELGEGGGEEGGGSEGERRKINQKKIIILPLVWRKTRRSHQ